MILKNYLDLERSFTQDGLIFSVEQFRYEYFDDEVEMVHRMVCCRENDSILMNQNDIAVMKKTLKIEGLENGVHFSLDIALSCLYGTRMVYFYFITPCVCLVS